MIYLGKRTEDGCRVYKIHEDMSIEELTPDKSLEVMNHSPTGFEWGYGGSGPSQLALALLLDAIGSKDAALFHYHDLKREVISGLPDSCWALHATYNIRAWYERQPDVEPAF